MTALLITLAVQLAHILYACLSPLHFPLNLTLLLLAVRLILSLAYNASCTQTHELFSTLLLNLFMIMVAHLIIVALLISALKGANRRSSNVLQNNHLEYMESFDAIINDTVYTSISDDEDVPPPAAVEPAIASTVQMSFSPELGVTSCHYASFRDQQAIATSYPVNPFDEASVTNSSVTPSHVERVQSRISPTSSFEFFDCTDNGVENYQYANEKPSYNNRKPIIDTKRGSSEYRKPYNSRLACTPGDAFPAFMEKVVPSAPPLDLINCVRRSAAINIPVPGKKEDLLPQPESNTSRGKELLRRRSDNGGGSMYNYKSVHGSPIHCGSYLYYERTPPLHAEEDDDQHAAVSVSCPASPLQPLMYTACRSDLDSLSKEDANKHFSEFASRKWAIIRKPSRSSLLYTSRASAAVELPWR